MRSCRAIPFVLCAPLLCAVLLPGRAAQVDAPTAEDLVRDYERHIGALGKATYSVHVKGYVNHPDFVRDGPYRDSFARWWRYGPRVKLVQSDTMHRVVKGKVRTTKSAHEHILADKRQVTIRYNETGELPDGIIATLDVPSNTELLRANRFSPLVDGITRDDPRRVSETLTSSRMLVRKGEIDGRLHWIVEGTGKWGYHALWLDPSRDHFPVRFVQRKQADDWLLDSTLANVPKSMRGPWSEYQLQVDATAVSVIAGRNVPTGFTTIWQVHRADGKFTEREVISLTDVNLDPDFSTDPFVPTVSIPDGFQVTVEGQEQIDHVWRNGRVVKAVNESSLANLAGNWFQQGSMLGRGLLLLGLLALVGLGLVYWLRRRRAVAG